MIRLLRSVSILMLVLIVGLVAIIGLTYRNTNRFAYLFANLDGTRCETPCLVGIDPRGATLEQAEQFLLASLTFNRMAKQKNDKMREITYSTDQIEVSLSHAEDGIAISFNFKTDQPTLSELLLLLGKPERIGVTKNHFSDGVICDYLVFWIQGKMVILRIQERANRCIRPAQGISELILIPANFIIMERMTFWHGFSTDEFYESLEEP